MLGQEKSVRYLGCLPLCRADGKLNFRGLVASPDGKKIHETTRTGEWTEESVLRLGREAGEELKVWPCSSEEPDRQVAW